LKKTMLLTLRWSSYFSGWWSENVKKTCKSSKNTHTIPTSFFFNFFKSKQSEIDETDT
jgi:hypothetical protein